MKQFGSIRFADILQAKDILVDDNLYRTTERRMYFFSWLLDNLLYDMRLEIDRAMGEDLKNEIWNRE